MNIALYGRRSNRWAMTERRASQLERDADNLRIGPSQVSWVGGELIADLSERGAPLPLAVRGRVRVSPETMTKARFDLDRDGRHQWTPYAPRARVEVTFTEPQVQWSGWGYMDRNFGSARLEHDFHSWDWARAHFDDSSAILYNATGRNARARPVAIQINADGGWSAFDAPNDQRLAPTLWRIDRRTQTDAGQTAKVIRTLEDTPFYARSTLATSLLGRRCTAVHETLSLARFANPVVQAMLPFRMPRIFWK